MHETEQAAAANAVSNSVITDAEMTDGFVMGGGCVAIEHVRSS